MLTEPVLAAAGVTRFLDERVLFAYGFAETAEQQALANSECGDYELRRFELVRQDVQQHRSNGRGRQPLRCGRNGESRVERAHQLAQLTRPPRLHAILVGDRQRKV